MPAGASATFSGSLQDGSGGLSLLMGGTGTQVLAGSNTYSGGTTINGGTLLLASTAAASPNSTYTLNSNNSLAFATGLTAPVLGGLSGGENQLLATTSNQALNLTVGGNGASTVYSGILSGSSGSLTVAGGLLTLTGSNTYTGLTTISGGTLQIGGGAAGLTGSVSTAIVDNANLVYSFSSGYFAYGAAANFPNVVTGTGNILVNGNGGGGQYVQFTPSVNDLSGFNGTLYTTNGARLRYIVPNQTGNVSLGLGASGSVSFNGTYIRIETGTASAAGQTVTYTSPFTVGAGGAGLYVLVPNTGVTYNPSVVFSGNITLGGTMWTESLDARLAAMPIR